MPRTSAHAPDCHVIGGGVAGLTAALYLARAGRRVRLLEKSTHLGGRARSQTRAGVTWNLGPHALYQAGCAAEILDELGIPRAGRVTDVTGSVAVRGGRAHALPVGLVSLMTTGLLSLGDKLALARIMSALPKLDPADYETVTYRAAIHRLTDREPVRELLLAIARLSTYGNAPDHMIAAPVLAQIQLAMAGGVRYLDGGWQSMVDALADAARAAGVVIETGARVDSLAGLTGPIVVATPPQVAAALTGTDFAVRPVRAACLDLTLRGLPRRRTWFALGIDTPTYLAVHTRYARLAPEGTDVVHAAKYLPHGAPSDPAADRAEIEATVDAALPGWRDHVIDQRFLPSLTVTHALPGARPAVAQGGDLYLAGDWVGGDGLLVDAALASARAAARMIAGAELSEARAA